MGSSIEVWNFALQMPKMGAMAWEMILHRWCPKPPIGITRKLWMPAKSGFKRKFEAGCRMPFRIKLQENMIIVETSGTIEITKNINFLSNYN